VKHAFTIDRQRNPGQRSLQRLEQQCARFGRQLQLDDQRTVVVVEMRETLESTRHADLLPRRAEIETALPAEPVRARPRVTIVPSPAPVGLRDQTKPTVVGRVQVTGQLGNPGFEFADGKPGFGGWGNTVHDTLQRAVLINSALVFLCL
jgi:hypothetical protein